MTNSFPYCGFRFPIIAAEYELIKVNATDILFNGIYGRHVRIKNIHPVVRSVVHLCDGTQSTEDIVSKTTELHKVSPDSVINILMQLYKKGVIKDNFEHEMPEWMSESDMDRYKTLLYWFDGFCEEGETPYEFMGKLKHKRVGIIGVGGTGSLISMMLAATGIGYLRLVDGDVVERSNLVRQIFYSESSVGSMKVDVLGECVRGLNPSVALQLIPKFITSCDELPSLIRDLDFVFLQADEPRFVLNRWVNKACVEYGVPYINSFANLIGPIFVPGKSPCFACVEQHIKSTFPTEYYDSVILGLQSSRPRKYPSIASGITLTAHYQFNDAIAYLTGIFPPITANGAIKLSLQSPFGEIEEIARNDDCPVCGETYVV
ncbi:HesA/MoeB/ThiF family protein [Ferroacidibacillus organovorans]|uniref:THIF-type NAD/FAD binding fold domain-containing protein n=1 Tax=Ferroacidibacillus organovorans TaxID=1765683 RepID=A0A101XNZ9_9BACL|nr:ThiF family adenylyltransferase [Ferroacidibacillus organovorans]KUO94918.1 hypothetical protein ATW55_15455 [Ferroacidibacillus organovorans]